MSFAKMLLPQNRLNWSSVDCCASMLLLVLLSLSMLNVVVDSLLFYPRGGSLGYLAAVAMPLDLPQRNVYVAFNFEANYGVPPNSSYLEWVERWNIAQENFGIGNNVTGIDGRRRFSRDIFYRSFVGYANHFGLNGGACLLRTICEVTASELDAPNGLLGSLFKILFMPTTSKLEQESDLDVDMDIELSVVEKPTQAALYAAEWHGENGNCEPYLEHCSRGILDMITEWI